MLPDQKYIDCVNKLCSMKRKQRLNIAKKILEDDYILYKDYDTKEALNHLIYTIDYNF